MPCKIMFILQMAQVVPLLSWPASARLRGLPPVSSTSCLAWISMPPEPTVGSQDLHAFLGIEEQDQQAIDLGRRVELAALLAGAVGEVLDQVLVGRAQQVGKFEAGVVEGDGVEVVDELNQGLVLE